MLKAGQPRAVPCSLGRAFLPGFRQSESHQGGGEEGTGCRGLVFGGRMEFCSRTVLEECFLQIVASALQAAEAWSQRGGLRALTASLQSHVTPWGLGKNPK